MYQEAEVRRGAALLDEKEPAWRKRFNPEALNMADLYECVLGQVFGHYLTGHKRLFGELPEPNNTTTAVRYGFVVPSELWERNEEFDQANEKLGKTWKALTPHESRQAVIESTPQLV